MAFVAGIRGRPAAARRRRALMPVLRWSVAGGLAVAAVARLTAADERWTPLVLTTGLTPMLYLPAYPVLALCLLRRRRACGTVMAGLVALHVTWVGQVLERPEPTPVGTPLRVMTANLYQWNPDSSRIGAEIASYRPDVVVLQELNRRTASGVARALSAYPYGVARVQGGAAGIGIYSRWPVRYASVADLGGNPMLSVTVLADGRPVRVLAVHTVAPLGPELPRWRQQLDDLARLLRDHGSGPVVVAGDFNATLDHRSLRRVLAEGLDDAARSAGRAWRPTWPRNRRVPPLLQVDHVLVSPEIGVRRVREGRGTGSDHRPVVADLVLPPAGATPGVDR